jgi:MscS family membrane protein
MLHLELTPHHWSLISVLVATLLAHFLSRLALTRMARIAANTSNVWDDVLLESARRPLPVLIWLSGALFAAYLHYDGHQQAVPVWVGHVRTLSLTLCVAWFFFVLIRKGAEGVTARQVELGQEVDRTTVEGISKIARITVVVLTGLVSIESLGFSISGVLAFGGIGGIAIGFAAKDFLANLLGGLMLHLDRPFRLGETIRSPDKQLEGQVEYIGWRQTALRSRNMDMIYVPNSIFNSIVLVNLSRRSHRRIEETIGLRYADLPKVAAICDEVRAMLQGRDDIDTSRELIVAFNTYGESSLDLTVQAFTFATGGAEFGAAKQSILLMVAAIVARNGADFAFPTRTLHMADGNPVLD